MNKHRKAAEGRACVRCGFEGTTVLAHYTGAMANKLGKGMGLKPHDLAGAWLCHRCHDVLDGRTPTGCPPLDRAHELAIYCLMTVIKRYEEGQLSDPVQK